jgi:divalent metal cation (Fe/Co/Zn/Cd) transporter
MQDLSDKSVSPRTQQSLLEALEPMTRRSTNGPSPNGSSHHTDLSISSLRARRAGSLMFVDLIATVPGSITIKETTELEDKIQDTLKNARREIKEVRVTFRPK